MLMKGGGYYSRAAAGARHVIDGATGLVLDALDRMAPGDDGTVFTMADMGCADGGTSLGMVGTVLRRAAPAPAVAAVADGPYRSAPERLQRAVSHGAGIRAPRRDREPVGLCVGDLVSPADIAAGRPARH